MTGEKIKRQSFIFYESFYNSIEKLDRSTQADILLALVRYGLRGEIDPGLKPISNALFLSFKPQIDKNNQKYLNGLKGGEYGTKGGRPQNKTPKKPLVNPKKTPNDNDNVNDNENVNEEKKEFNKKVFRDKLLALGVERKYLNDWFAVRDKKKAAYTSSALNRFIRECTNNGIKIGDAVRICAERGWQGFQYEWAKEELQKSGAKTGLAALPKQVI